MIRFMPRFTQPHDGICKPKLLLLSEIEDCSLLSASGEFFEDSLTKLSVNCHSFSRKLHLHRRPMAECTSLVLPRGQDVPDFLKSIGVDDATLEAMRVSAGHVLC